MSDYASHEAAAHEAAALPLPPPARLVGREAVLAPVYAQLKAGRAVLLHGPAGAGKSAVAATLANAYAQQPGGVLWLNVDHDPLEALIVRVGRAYGISEVMTTDSPIGLVGAVASTLTQHKPFVVLDGPLDSAVAARFVTRCAERLPVLLLNEADQDGAGAWTSIPLPPLDAASALALFKQDAGIAASDSDADIAEIVRLLGHQPFAIGVAARAMLGAKQPPAAYKAVLAQVAATVGQSPATVALAASFGPLNGALQGIILIMSAVPTGAASAELLSMVGGAPVESVAQVMNLLVSLKWVERATRYGAPYYQMHPLAQAFALERLRTSDRLKGLQDKLRDTVVAFVQKYNIAGDADSQGRLAAEMANVLAIAREAAGEGQRDVANQLVVALTQGGDFVSRRGYVYELLQLRSAGTGYSNAFPAYQDEAPAGDVFELLESIGDDDDAFDDDDDEAFDELADDDADDEVSGFNVAALIAADDLDEDDDLDDAGDDADDLDDDDEGDGDGFDFAPPPLPRAVQPVAAPPAAPAFQMPAPDDIAGLRAALARARQDGDRARQIELLRAIGAAQVAQHMHNEAIATYGEALTAYEGAGDQRGALDMLEMLSALMLKTENSSAAVMNAARGVKLAESLGDAETQMQLLITLGDARQQLGESDQAATAYGAALGIARNRNDAQHEAIILYKLGSAQLDSGDAQSAIETLEGALAMFKGQGKRDYEGRVLGALGSAYGELERWAEALNFHMSALYIAREVRDSEEESLQLSSLGYASIQAGQLGQAVLRYRQALHLAYQANNRSNIVSTLIDLARLLIRSPRHLSVTELLIDEALRYDAHDKDARQFKERITAEKTAAAADGVNFVPVNGAAQTYAANAYKLLDE